MLFFLDHINSGGRIFGRPIICAGPQNIWKHEYDKKYHPYIPEFPSTSNSLFQLVLIHGIFSIREYWRHLGHVVLLRQSQYNIPRQL